MWYDKMKKVKRSRIRFYDSTISYQQGVFVKMSKSCNHIYDCQGSLNPFLYFPALTRLPYDLYWTSSIGSHSLSLRHPLFVGRSGYFSNFHPSYFVQDSSQELLQRPALYYIGTL